MERGNNENRVKGMNAGSKGKEREREGVRDSETEYVRRI